MRQLQSVDEDLIVHESPIVLSSENINDSRKIMDACYKGVGSYNSGQNKSKLCRASCEKLLGQDSLLLL